MRAAFIAAALLAAAPLPAMAGRFSHQRAEVKQVEQFIENEVGVPVLWALSQSQHCKAKRGSVIYGYYSIKYKKVIMCPAARTKVGGPLALIKHEGWHAIQHNCTGMRATLSDEQIRARISTSDRRALRELYPNKQHRSEAEARAVETLPTDVWLRGSRKVCQ